MLGLIKDFAITALIMILSHWVYGIEDTVSHDFLVDFIAGNKTLFLAIGILGSGTMLICAAMFQGLGLSQVTFMMSSLFVRVCQFFITFLCTLNIVFYASMGINLIQDSGHYILIILIFTLGVSCWALRIIDFNHDTRNALMPPYTLAFMSVVLVEYFWPFYGF